MNISETLKIDGSLLEGGGQILRNASALSSIIGQPIRIENIRAGREKPGLRPQHLSGLQLTRDISSGILNSCFQNSTCIEYTPGPLAGGNFLADTKTAGSICLLVQSILPCLLFSKRSSNVLLKGGTNAGMAPPIDYFIEVLKPTLKKMGIDFDLRIIRRGYYPKGGGEVELTCESVKCIEPIVMLEPGHLQQIYGTTLVAGCLPNNMAHIMRETVERQIQRKYGDIPVNIEIVKDTNSIGNASLIVLFAKTTNGMIFGASALVERGMKAKDVSEKALSELFETIDQKVCIDQYMQDQLIIFMALAQGESQIKCGPITLHTETAIYVANLLIPQAKFRIETVSNQTNTIQNIIHCSGIGKENN